MAAAHYQHAPALVARAVGAEDVRDPVGDAVAVGALAHRRQAAGAERVRSRPCARRVDDGAREMALLDAVALDAQLERRLVAARVLELVDAVARDGDHARVEVQSRRDLGQRSQRLEIAVDDLGPRRVFVVRRRVPTVGAEQLRGGRVDVVLPRREQTDVGPLADARADAVTGLEHDGLQAAREKVRRGCEAHGAGADHRDGKLLGHL
jgi:hypothetical protein